MPFPEFGPFEAVFEKGELEVPGYLKLLNLLKPEAQIVLDRIERALSAGDPAPWVAALLGEPNWRPHLVGAIAFLLDQSQKLDCELLWRTVDHGSWVIPQLVVTAVFVDPSFPERARARVAEECPVAFHPGMAKYGIAPRPGASREPSAKMLASLLAASAELPSLARWAEELRREARIQKLLEDDAWNGSEKIVASWMRSVRTAFRERGRVLTPKST